MPFMSPSACFTAWPERDADILGGVVMIDVQIALGLDRDVDARVARQQIEHVVEEADAGRNRRTALPVEIDFDLDVGFLGLALHGGFAHGEALNLRAFYQGLAGFATSLPSPRRRRLPHAVELRSVRQIKFPRPLGIVRAANEPVVSHGKVVAGRSGAANVATRSDASLARRIALWATAILLLLAVMEGASAIFLHMVIGSTAHFLIWNPDLDAAHRQWISAAGNWDDELGWPSPREAVSSPRNSTGAKFNPDFPQTEHPCASAYGNSFVWSDDIPLADGWIEQVSRKLGCRVANYGVGGYGTDQAYLRFTHMTRDDAPIVLLGIFPENIMRNVNQYRGFIGFTQDPRWLKGRFVLDGAGKLEWIHRPRTDEAGFVRLLREPASVVPRDYLLPDTHDGPVTLRYPYLLTLARLTLMPRVWVRITAAPTWTNFFRPDHPSGGLALTAAIAEAFAREAKLRGKRALVVMLPGVGSFRNIAKFGEREYAPLLTMLADNQVDVFDPSAAILAALGQRSYCELYAFPANCTGHLGIAGSGIVADVVASELRRRGLVK